MNSIPYYFIRLFFVLVLKNNSCQGVFGAKLSKLLYAIGNREIDGFLV
jgi:hypothetical protein